MAAEYFQVCKVPQCLSKYTYQRQLRKWGRLLLPLVSIITVVAPALRHEPIYEQHSAQLDAYLYL
jgi:hypothetical protein